MKFKDLENGDKFVFLEYEDRHMRVKLNDEYYTIIGLEKKPVVWQAEINDKVVRYEGFKVRQVVIHNEYIGLAFAEHDGFIAVVYDRHYEWVSADRVKEIQTYEDLNPGDKFKRVNEDGEFVKIQNEDDEFMKIQTDCMPCVNLDNGKVNILLPFKKVYKIG